jgi:hypothetical protein
MYTAESGFLNCSSQTGIPDKQGQDKQGQGQTGVTGQTGSELIFKS